MIRLEDVKKNLKSVEVLNNNAANTIKGGRGTDDKRRPRPGCIGSDCGSMGTVTLEF